MGHKQKKFLRRSEEHTSELQSRGHLVCRLLLEKKNKIRINPQSARLAIDEKGRTAAELLFFFNDTATTEIYTLSLHDALPIYLIQRRMKHFQTNLAMLKEEFLRGAQAEKVSEKIGRAHV